MRKTTSAALHTMIRGLPDLSLLVDVPTDTIVEVGDHGLRELGWERSDVLGVSIESFVHPDDRVNWIVVNQALSAGETVHFDQRVRTRVGEWLDYNFAARLVDDDFINVVGRPIAALAHPRSKLADLVKLADLTGDLFLVTDADGIIHYANAAAHELHGHDRLIGRRCDDLLDQSDEEYRSLVGEIAAGSHEVQGRVVGLQVGGGRVNLGVRSVYDASTSRWYTIERDITAEVAREREVQRLNVDLRRRATTDSLTGVANRDAFAECVALALESDDPFAVLLLDMDDFKSVNDTHGHAVGDNFLRCIARRLQTHLALHDLVARLGGDEFVVYLPHCDVNQAAAKAALLVDTITRPFQIDELAIVRSCSVGGTVRRAGDDLSSMLRRADHAAYEAKAAGRSRFAMHCDTDHVLEIDDTPSAV